MDTVLISVNIFKFQLTISFFIPLYFKMDVNEFDDTLNKLSSNRDVLVLDSDLNFVRYVSFFLKLLCNVFVIYINILSLNRKKLLYQMF